MKTKLTQITNCSLMKVTPVEKPYAVKNHLYDMKEEYENIKEIKEKRNQLLGINFDRLA